MGTRTSYEPGTFCWIDLMTSDLDAAKQFYSAVFGWEYSDNDMGDGATYSMAQIDGTDVAGLMNSDQGPHWNNYIAVESAADNAEAAKEAGATIIQEPIEVPGSGHMAVFQDPTGAIVSTWQAGDHPGAGIVNQHGALSWNDLQTDDVGKAVDFYTDVFGWEVAPVENAPAERVVIRVGETMNGGIAKLPEEGGSDVPPHWLAYFAVDDLSAAIEAAEGAGGKSHIGPLDLPTGQLAILTDPQGAAFALFAGDLDD